jgi:hypothetical protein
MNPGEIKWCRLTRKKMIIQKVFININPDPMLLTPDSEVEKVLVRYWSQVQDKYFSHIMYPEELSDSKPEYNPNYDKALKT